MTTLSDADIAAALATLPGWTRLAEKKAIGKTYTFADFSEAFGFMARVALAAERANHHPDWSNVYRTVVVTLSTHDAGGVTEKDIQLARTMEKIAAARR